MKRILEICCTSLEDAKIASDNGANRIELCEDLEFGGVDRILSSAGLTKASDDPEKISKIVRLSQPKPSIICCGGIRSSNIKNLINIPKLVEFHSAASSNIKGVDPKEVHSIRSQIDKEIEL